MQHILIRLGLVRTGEVEGYLGVFTGRSEVCHVPATKVVDHGAVRPDGLPDANGAHGEKSEV